MATNNNDGKPTLGFMVGNGKRSDLEQKSEQDKMSDMSKATFHVLYDGPALASNEMDVRDLAPALLALGEVLEEANGSINDGRAKISVKVRASFKTGCFGIELESKRNGRSMNSEIVTRLQTSLHEQDHMYTLLLSVHQAVLDIQEQLRDK